VSTAVDDEYPAPYGDGLGVLVVGTAATPFGASAPALGVGGASVRVVLVDSGAPDVPPGVEVVRIGEDVGRGAAINRAVAALPPGVGLVAAAPADLDWPGGVLDAQRTAARRHPRAGILAPRVVGPDGVPVPSTHPLPRALGAVLRRTWPPAADVDCEGPFGWSSAPALLLRRTALDSVDGFDRRYPGRFDDLDLADRLARTGWLTVHVPSAEVVYEPVVRPDPAAARRYLADRGTRPVRELLRLSVRS